MRYASCVMGCRKIQGISLHSFPNNAKRRAEWCNILGINTCKKHIYLCSAHIPNCYINGNRLSIFATPNPPDPLMLGALRKTSYFTKFYTKREYPKQEKQFCESIPRFEVQQSGLKTFVAENLSQDKSSLEIFDEDSSATVVAEETGSKLRENIPQSEVQQSGLKTIVADNLTQDNTDFESSSEDSSVTDVGDETVGKFRENIPQFEVQQSSFKTVVAQELKQNNNNLESPYEDSNATAVGDETVTNVENFEIRKGSNNDMIIKGRYIQTKDHLIVSYTPPKKWSLQVQVGLLDKICTNQLNTINLRNKANHRLLLQLKQHEKLLPKLRYLQKRNRTLSVQLKMYKKQEKNLRRIIRARRLKTALTTSEGDNTEK